MFFTFVRSKGLGDKEGWDRLQIGRHILITLSALFPNNNAVLSCLS
jgi:hypothetical protein